MLLNEREVETLIILCTECFVKLNSSEIIDGIKKELFQTKENYLIFNGCYVISKENELAVKVNDYENKEGI